jgi:hypothetical protein
VKTKLTEVFCEGGICIQLDQDYGQWQVLVGPIIDVKLRVLLPGCFFLTWLQVHCLSSTLTHKIIRFASVMNALALLS